MSTLGNWNFGGAGSGVGATAGCLSFLVGSGAAEPAPSSSMSSSLGWDMAPSADPRLLPNIPPAVSPVGFGPSLAAVPSGLKVDPREKPLAAVPPPNKDLGSASGCPKGVFVVFAAKGDSAVGLPKRLGVFPEVGVAEAKLVGLLAKDAKPPEAGAVGLCVAALAPKAPGVDGEPKVDEA